MQSIFNVYRDQPYHGRGSRIRGLIRCSSTIVGKFIGASGRLCEGVSVFCEPFAWDLQGSVEPFDTKPRLAYVKREEGEDHLLYVVRAFQDAGRSGLHLGDRELAHRCTRIAGVAQPCQWATSAVPADHRKASGQGSQNHLEGQSHAPHGRSRLPVR